jgi:uncharacterized protein (DUF885 family)
MRLPLLLSMFLACTLSVAAAEPDPQATKALHALFDRSWQAVAERFPEFATYRGDYRYNDRLADASPAAQAGDFARLRQELAEARAIPAERLSATDRVSRDMFIRGSEGRLALEAYEGYRLMGIGALGGTQSDLSDLLRVVPMARVEQVEQLFRRLAAFPNRMDQEIANLRRGMALGYVPPRTVLERALAQIDAQLPADAEAGPFYAPFKRLGQGIAADEQARLQAAGRAAVERDVLPAMRRLRAFVAGEYLAKAPPDGALLRYPDGVKLYDELVRQQTTTEVTASAVHAIGLREMARLRGEMEAVMRQTKFEGDFAAFIKYLNTDPRFFHKRAEDFLAGYRDITKRIDAELPRLFAELPRMPYGVRAMPAHFGPDRAEYYDRPAQDGSRPGYFNANALGYAKRPTWAMASLAAHEAVPGHHLQIARGQELRSLPEFRRGGFGLTAFVEGWALYAETLGNEIGLYEDPYSRFGHLQWQALRAARLVVDTGIHAKGWSRQQAVDYMIERTGIEPGFVNSEVDRYTSDPGQALAYMIGQLKIIELRDRAKTKLGARFDIRRFHNAVIDNGALPLTTLEALIDEWIEQQAKSS